LGHVNDMLLRAQQKYEDFLLAFRTL